MDSLVEASTSNSNGAATKRVRNQNACDLCRSRRVKCRFSEGATTCDGCKALDVECRADRPRRKRGPINRHAEAHRRVTTAGDARHDAVEHPDYQSVTPGSHPSPHTATSPGSGHTPGSHHTLSPRSVPAQPKQLGLSAIGPTDEVYHLLDDWFEFIHPLAPILHRRRMMQRLYRGDADTDPVFLALIASTCAATVSTLTRKNYTETDHPITAEKCLNLIFDNNLLPHDHPYTVDWCVARYHCTAALPRILPDTNGPELFRMLSEIESGTMYMVHYKMSELSFFEQEIIKRLYWLIVAGLMTLDLLGRPYLGIFTVQDYPTSFRPHPLTDLQLDGDPSLMKELPLPEWHGDNTSYIDGLNRLNDVFLIWHQAQMDCRYMSNEETVRLGMNRIQDLLDKLPLELRWRGGLSRPVGATKGHDSQIANIFVTSLHVRSNLLQRYGNPRSKEHRLVVGDLLEVLRHLPQLSVEANGWSLVPKIRDIGSAYLEEINAEATYSAVEDAEKARLADLIQSLDTLDFKPIGTPVSDAHGVNS